MINIVEILKSFSDYIGGTGCSDTEIDCAEKQLGVRFAPEYRCYLREIGLACFDGHELTGICKSLRLNVIDVTITQRNQFPETYAWYVIEEANIDGIVLWQAPSGEIYQTAPATQTRKVFDSLAEYIIQSASE